MILVEGEPEKMTSRPRVLCAEPSSDVRSMLCKLLAINGFDSDSASTVSEAVLKAQDGDFCLYIVDDEFDDGSNIELIRRLRALTPSVPVMVFSTLAFESRRRAAAEAGAVAYMMKPLDLDRLVGAAVRLCGAA